MASTVTVSGPGVEPRKAVTIGAGISLGITLASRWQRENQGESTFYVRDGEIVEAEIEVSPTLIRVVS